MKNYFVYFILTMFLFSCDDNKKPNLELQKFKENYPLLTFNDFPSIVINEYVTISGYCIENKVNKRFNFSDKKTTLGEIYINKKIYSRGWGIYYTNSSKDNSDWNEPPYRCEGDNLNKDNANDVICYRKTLSEYDDNSITKEYEGICHINVIKREDCLPEEYIKSFPDQGYVFRKYEKFLCSYPERNAYREQVKKLWREEINKPSD